MRNSALLLIFVSAVAAATYFYFFSGKEFQFRFSEAQLTERLTKRLPIKKTYLFIFEVGLDNPRLSLVDGTDRIEAGLDVELNVKLGSESLPLGGTLDASGGVRYEPSEGEIYLTDPVVEHLQIQGIPAEYTDRVNTVLASALSDYYREHPIYHLRATDAKQLVAKLVLKSVSIQNEELVITLGI